MSPIRVEKGRFSLEASSSPVRGPTESKSDHRRSQTESRDSLDRKGSLHRSIKKEAKLPAPSSSFEDREISDSRPSFAMSDLRSQEDSTFDGRDAVPAGLPLVDLSRVKAEPTEYSPHRSEQPQTWVVSQKVQLWPELTVETASVPSMVPPPDAEHLAVLPRTIHESIKIKKEIAEDPVNDIAESSQSEVPSYFGGASVLPEATLRADQSNKTSATQSNSNTSHTEGYSSGMDSEESLSDVERAVPGQFAEKEPIVKKEPRNYVKYFVPKENFKDAVIKEVGPYLKKFYKKHQISKEDYKEIFKKVIKKVCTSSSEKKRLVCTKAIHRLCHTYVKRARIQIKLDCKFGEGV